MALMEDVAKWPIGQWVPVVVGIMPRRRLPRKYVLIVNGGEISETKTDRYISTEIWGDHFMTGICPNDPKHSWPLREAYIEEVEANDPFLLGPFAGRRGIQSYCTLHEAQQNLNRLLLFISKQDPSLRSSVAERPFRKRQVDSSNLSGGSKWIRRQEYQKMLNAESKAKWDAIREKEKSVDQSA